MLRQIFLAAFTALSILSSWAQISSQPLNIIPEPVQTVRHPGQFTIDRATKIAFQNQTLASSASYLADYLNNHLGYPLQVKEGKIESGSIVLTDTKNGQVSGGYQLDITPEGIEVQGNDEAGVFYGIQTLIQLLPTRAGVLPVLPALTITDHPNFEYRGMHLDVVRHFFPVSFIKKYIDYLALHKMNYFHWHLTDDQGWRIEMKCRPELTMQGSLREGEIEGLYPGVYKPLPYGGYYTHEQVKEIVAYAHDRHVTVIPEIDIPGHCMAVLATYPQFSTTPTEPKKAALTWGIFNKFNNVLAPTPEVFDFLNDVFTELCDLFPGAYIHVGGDECAKRWWQESAATQKFMRKHKLADEKALQSYFIDYVQQVVNAKGKTLIGWDEILEGGVSKDCVIMNWRKPLYGVNAVQAGHRTVMTSSAWTYFNRMETNTQIEIGAQGPLSLEKVYTYPIIPEGLTSEQSSLVWGGQGCLWTEYIPTTWKAEFALFPRLSALAENLWSPAKEKNWENFVRKMESQFERYDLWGARYSEAFFRTNDVVRKR